MDLAKINKAIELAEYYKDNILNYYLPIDNLFEISGIKKILLQSDNKPMNSFDEIELKQRFSSEQIEAINKIIDSDAFGDAVAQVAVFSNLKLNIVKKKEVDKESGEAKTYVSKKQIADEFYDKVICKTLNNLEYFAMFFIQGVAEEDSIYQSIHQTYIDIVELLYYQIADNNKKPSDKYFTKTIELYKIWKRKHDEMEHKQNIEVPIGKSLK